MTTSVGGGAVDIIGWGKGRGFVAYTCRLYHLRGMTYAVKQKPPLMNDRSDRMQLIWMLILIAPDRLH